MTISEIVVYPIKSLRGISVSSWPLEPRGLRHDRRWMVVDEGGLFLTARKLHRMAMIETAFTDGGLRCELGGNAIRIPFAPQGNRVKVQVWNDVCDAVEVCGEASEWFSHALGQSCRLVYMPEDSKRPLKAPGHLEGELVSFTDSNPVLIAGQTSIDDLNARLDQPIPIRRFRPNLVIEGAKPFEEDDWNRIEIGHVSLRRTMKAGRCLVTTLDIETGETSEEPLRTLATYRKEGSHVRFGSYYAPTKFGVISVGDPVSAA